MATIKETILTILADHISDNIAALAGKVHTNAPGPEEIANFPCSTVLFTAPVEFEPHQEVERWASTALMNNSTVYSMGDFTASIEIRVYAKSAAQRAALEESVANLFLVRRGAPGTLVLDTGTLTVNGTVTLYDAPIGYMLDGVQWSEEFAFEGRRYSFIDLQAEFPALVVLDETTINAYHVAINHDLESDTPDETIAVDEFGNVTIPA